MIDRSRRASPFVQLGDKRNDRFRGCLLGLAAGDAVGTTLEFRQRGSFEPLRDMAGGGPFNLQPGQWTDDTSMALCLAASLVELGRFDADDQMQRYLRWRDRGYMSSNGRCFDVGGTIAQALSRYEQQRNPLAGSDHPHTAGNGSIMRLAPVVMFYASNSDQAVHYAVESSRTTHAAPECLDACRLLAVILCRALEGLDKDSIFRSLDTLQLSESSIRSIARGNFIDKNIDEIHGTGYVVESLEAALWCFYHAPSFEAAVLAAANLGDDADTTAAVCGQLAGAHYGIDSIPASWLDRLAGRSMIEQMAVALVQ